MDWWVFIIGAFNAATRAVSCYPELVSNSLEFVACLFLFLRLFLFLFTITDTNYGGDVQIQHNRMSWNEETLA